MTRTQGRTHSYALAFSTIRFGEGCTPSIMGLYYASWFGDRIGLKKIWPFWRKSALAGFETDSVPKNERRLLDRRAGFEPGRDMALTN